MKKILLPILLLLTVGLTLISCELFEEDVKLITIDVTSNKSIFLVGDNIKDHLTVKSFYSDGSEKSLSKESYSTNLTDDKVTSSTDKVTVIYKEGSITKSNTIQIFVKDDSKTLISLDVTSDKYVFDVGEEIISHLTVKGLYSDNSEKTISNTDYTVSPTVVTSSTDKVTVTYETKTQTIPIFLKDDSKTLYFIDVTLSSSDYVFSVGDYVKDHLIVKGYYSDGTVETISDYSTDLTDNKVTSTTNSVTVSYTESDVTKTKSIPISVDSGKTLISIDVTSDKYVFDEGEVITSHLTVKGLYSDGSEQTVTDYSTDLIDNKVSSTTNSVTVSYTESDVTKTKTIPISVDSGKTLISIDVTINTDKLYEGDDIKDYLTVKGFYTNGFERIVPKEDYSTDLIGDKVTSTTYSVTVTYIDGGVEQTKSITITLGNLLDFEIDKNWFNNFSGVNKNDVTSISFVKEKPSDVTDEGKTVGKFSYYKKGTGTYDLYVVGERIVFPSNCSEMFKDFLNVKTIDLSNVDTSNVTNMSYMFYGCRNLTSLNLSKFNTSKVTNMSYMFEYCSLLTSLDLSNFNTSNVTDMRFMFENCMGLRSLNISNKFDTSKVTNMESMFYLCYDLTSLDLSSFNTSNVTDMSSMFSGCSSLTSVKINPTHKDKFGSVLGGFTLSGDTYTKN